MKKMCRKCLRTFNLVKRNMYFHCGTEMIIVDYSKTKGVERS